MSQSFAEALSWVPVSAVFSTTLGRAHEYARAQAHRTVTLEHLLLALTDDPDASTVLQASNIDISRLMNDASAHLGHLDDRVAPGQPLDPGADEALVRILDYAAAAARQSRRREINGAIVLAAIVGEARSVAASMLQAQGLTFEGAIKALQRTPVQAPQPPRQGQPAGISGPPMQLPVPHNQPVAAPAPPVDPPATINGAATQTNEQILANVRRRIDANRAAPKPVVSPPAREPYPSPPDPTSPRPTREEVVTTMPPAVAPASAQAPVEPVAVAPPVVMPAPSVSVSVPVADKVEQAPPSAQPRPNVRPHSPAAGGLDDPYAGLYPEPPSTPPAPVIAPYPADFEVASPPPAPADTMPARRPPPIPSLSTLRPAPVIAEPPPSPLRPRQLGAPVVPPSSVAWPAPVQPQPAALPPAIAPGSPQVPPLQRSRSQPEANPLDGGIAGAPYPEPDSVPPRPAANVPVLVPARRTKQSAAAAALEAGQLVENVPRTMRVGKPEVIEVRIAKAGLRALTDGMQGSAASYLHDLVVTKAMSVRLRSPDRGFIIDTGSPETQWIDNSQVALGDDFASWRWNVTPLRRGAGRLQLVVSARTIASDGLSADTALPDQVFDIAVRADYGRLFKQAVSWACLMLLGGVLSRFGQNGFETVATMWRGFQ